MNRKGEGYIEVAVSLLLIFSVILFSLEVFSLLSLRTDLSYMAKEMAEVIATNGCIGSASEARLAQLEAETGLSPTVSYSGTKYFSTARRLIQYGETVAVTLEVRSAFFGFTVRASSSALSRVYWK